MSDQRETDGARGATSTELERDSRVSTMRPPAPAPPRPAPPRPRMTKSARSQRDTPISNDRPTPRSTVIPRLPSGMVVPAMRPKLSTLIFHGAPPIPPPLPTIARVAERETLDDVHSSELLVDDEPDPADDDRVGPIPFPFGIARTERPPPVSSASPDARSRRAVAIGMTIALALPLAIFGVAHLFTRSDSSTGAATRSVGASAPGAKLASSARTPGTCEVTGTSHLLARRAIVRGGIEASVLGDRVAFAALTSPKTGTAFDLDATSLAVRGSARVVGERPLSRVVPQLVDDGPIDVIADTGALRSLPDADGDAAIGARDGFVTWGPRDGDGMMRLWRLESSQAVEAPRVAVLGASGERAVVFRQGGAIWIGSFRAGAVLSPLARLSSSNASTLVGSPSIDARGDEAIVAWAERDAESAPWAVRFVRWTSHGEPVVARDLALPSGGPGERAMAPSVAALEGSRFLLAWTETGRGRNQVRAQVFDGNDRALGEAMDVSPRDAMAGQEQIALVDSAASPGASRGAIAYLVAHRGAFELRATSIDCLR